MAKGLAQQIAEEAIREQEYHDQHYLGWYRVIASYIKASVKSTNLRGAAAQSCADKALLICVEHEFPEAALAYYSKMSPPPVGKYDEQLAAIQTFFRSDFKRVTGRELQ